MLSLSLLLPLFHPSCFNAITFRLLYRTGSNLLAYSAFNSSFWNIIHTATVTLYPPTSPPLDILPITTHDHQRQ
uniref:Putative secreted protein n=1 Tax=Anopheles darlingi TaxID=43151 RepID=A0A2M4DEB3_ANODA